ncbi:MAG: DUF167 domain-containing protein [Gemmatimonadales bacterium]
MRIAVVAQPRASRSEVVGPHGGALRIRIAAPPVGGAANEALIAFLASRLGVPRSAVTLRRGATGRRKLVEVEGIGPAEAAKALGL